MRIRYFLGFIFVMGLFGCASTSQQASDNAQMQVQISKLERNWEQSDQDMKELKTEVDSIREIVDTIESDQMEGVLKKKDGYSGKSSMSSQGSSMMKGDFSEEDILHVDVSPAMVQTALKNAGFYDGTVDGKLGQRSKKAVIDFQQAHDLKADGVIGAKTWSELKKYLQ